MLNNIDTKAKAGLLALLACVIFATFSLKMLSPPTALPASANVLSFSAERAMEHLKVIAKTPHSLGTPENEQVIKYIVQELENLGLEVQIQDTLISKTSKRISATRTARVKNIIGLLKGSNNSKGVMLMAHHDSQPNTPGAADDGSGVVAILETLRAIKAEGSLKNDLIVMITDGEEIGLMGAKAFVDYHPLINNIGVILNLEARGNQGVSMSFEMNPENGWIIREFAKSAPYPFTNSLAYEVYKIMPNDTDFSEFREKNIAGINSACVEGFVNYHSMTDTPENIDQNLIQHHGSNMLGMLRHFGNLDIKETKAPDATFFNPFGSKLIIYSAKLDLIFILITVLLYVSTVIIGLKKKQVILTDLLTGTGFFLVVLVLSGLGGYLLQQGIIALHPHYTLFYANNFYNVTSYFFSFLGLSGFFYLFILGFQPKLNSLSLSLGGILMLIMAMFGLTLSLPTSTYLLYFPIIFFLIGQLMLLLLKINAENRPIFYAIGQFLALLPAISLWAPTIYLFFTTFGLTQAVIAPMLIFCFLCLLFIPIIKMIYLWKKQLLSFLSILFIFFGLIRGATTSKPTKEKPLQTYLMYGLDIDNNKAVWATNKKYQNDWMKQIFIQDSPSSFDEIYPNWNWKIWTNPAPYTHIEASNLTLLSDTINIDNQKVREFSVNFDKLVNSSGFFLENGKDILAISINELTIPFSLNQKDDMVYFNFFAPPKEGFKLNIRTKNKELNIRIVDRIIGLPIELLPSPMPENMIHGPGTYSNVQLIKKSYSFE